MHRGISLPAPLNASRQRQRERGQLHTANTCTEESRCLHHSTPHVNANESAASCTRPTPAQRNLVACITQRLTSTPTPNAYTCTEESRCLHHSTPHVNANASAASCTRPTPAQGNLVACITRRLTSTPTPARPAAHGQHLLMVISLHASLDASRQRQRQLVACITRRLTSTPTPARPAAHGQHLHRGISLPASLNASRQRQRLTPTPAQRNLVACITRRLTSTPTPARPAAHGQHLLRGISLPASLDASRQRQRQRGQLHTANTCSGESRCLHHSTPHVNANANTDTNKKIGPRAMA